MAKKRAACSRPSTAGSPPRRRPSKQSNRVVWLVGLGGAALAGLVLAAVVVLSSGGNATARSYSCGELLKSPADASPADGFAVTQMNSQHIAGGARVSYATCPPTSGRHYNAAGRGPLRPGFYGPDDAAVPGGWVHNLEHGYVLALYSCTDGSCPSADELASLRDFVARGPATTSAVACGYRSKVIAARFDDMTSPYALLVWNRAMLMDIFDTSSALAFAGRWVEQTATEPTAC